MVVEENRIKLRVQQEATPISLQDQVDVKAQIKVDVETHLTGLGMAGVIALALGAIALVVGSAVFLTVYPDDWYGSHQDGSHYRYVELVELLWGVGIVLLLLGTAMFFYGRTVLGSGGLQQMESIESLGRQ